MKIVNQFGLVAFRSKKLTYSQSDGHFINLFFGLKALKMDIYIKNYKSIEFTINTLFEVNVRSKYKKQNLER